MQTATNPQTGDRLYLGADGQWRPLVTATNPQTGEQIYQDESGQWAPMVAPEQAPDVPITARGVGEQALQGLTLGFGDELRGAGGALVDYFGGTGGDVGFSDLYRLNRDEARESLAAFAEANPKTALAANIGGGMLTGALGGLRAAATPVGRFALAKLGTMPLGRRLMTLAQISAATGAAGGAVGGAGAAKEIADIPREAGIGAATGAALGGVAGPLSESVAVAAPAVTGAFRRAMDPDIASKRMAARSLRNSGIDTESAARERLSELGADARIADIGEGTQSRLDWLAQRPGTTGQRVIDELLPRSREQMGEVLEPFGAGRRLEALDELKRFRAEEASPLYERAFSEGVEHTPELQRIFKELEASDPGIWNEARRSGIRSALAEGTDLDPAMYGSDAVPSLRGWQAIKEHLDSLEGTARRGGDKPKARQYAGVRRRLLAELDEQNPTFKEARKQWAGSMAFEEAIEQGRKFAGSEASAITEDAIKKLSPTQKEGYRIGAIQSIEDRLEGQGWTHDATRYFRTPRMERKLKALFDNEEQFDAFMQRLDASATKQRTFSKATGGSDTARRLLYESEQLPEMAVGFGADLVSQGTPEAARNLTSKLARQIPTSRESTRNLLGELLLEADPQTQMSLLRDIYSPKPLVLEGAGLLPAAGMVPAGAGAASLSSGLLSPERSRDRLRSR